MKPLTMPTLEWAHVFTSARPNGRQMWHGCPRLVGKTHADQGICARPMAARSGLTNPHELRLSEGLAPNPVDLGLDAVQPHVICVGHSGTSKRQREDCK